MARLTTVNCSSYAKAQSLESARGDADLWGLMEVLWDFMGFKHQLCDQIWEFIGCFHGFCPLVIQLYCYGEKNNCITIVNK
jgi:hypothetical protein